jgi:hypothetical protein
MSYDVLWTPETGPMMATLWLESSDRSFFAWVVGQMESRLARDPLSAGESRTSSVDRIYFEHNVGIIYEVIEDDKKVFVHSIWVHKPE